MIFKYKVPVQPPYQAKSWTPLWRKNFRILNIIIFLVWFFTSKKMVPEKWGILNSVTACLIFGDMQPWMYWYIVEVGILHLNMEREIKTKNWCFWKHLFFQTLQPSKLVKLQHHSKKMWTCQSLSLPKPVIFPLNGKLKEPHPAAKKPHLRSTSEDSVPSTMTRPFLPGLPARISPAGWIWVIPWNQIVG